MEIFSFVQNEVHSHPQWIYLQNNWMDMYIYFLAGKRKEREMERYVLYIDWFGSTSSSFSLSPEGKKKKERRCEIVCTLTSVCSVCVRRLLASWIKMKSTFVFTIFFVLIPSVMLLAEEKLQVMTTKKVENCARRSKVGDTLYMQYTVSHSHLGKSRLRSMIDLRVF